MSKRNPWVAFVDLLLLASFIFTAVLLRAAPVQGIRGSGAIPPEVQGRFQSSYSLVAPTTNLAGDLGFVRQENEFSAVASPEIATDETLSLDEEKEGQAAERSRLVIYTVETSLVVADVDEALAAIEGLTAGAEGYVTSSSMQQYGESAQATITIRVPVPEIDAVRAELRALALEVRNETRRG